MVIFNLHGKVALVTGIGRGLGRAMGVALAEAGSDLAGLYYGKYRETQQEIEALGRRFLPIQCDLSTASTGDLEAVVQRVVDEYGRLDILINNAGIIRRTPAIDYSEEDWNAVMQVNLKSLFFLSQSAARVMSTQGGGKIIQIASLLSFQGGNTVPSYTAAKHGVAGLTRALANELAAKNINVNAIVPGYFATDNTEELRNNPERNHAILERIPAGRWGQPDDIKGAAIFLASAASDYVHGALIPVDGGWLGR
jgi:2-deoxy-D-gluconate 3-dehydrogenase